MEIYYLEQKPVLDEGPFSRGERNLLNALTARLGKALERMNAEDGLKRAHLELERRVAERTTDLLKANEQLAREVEERKKAEAAVREGENDLRKLTGKLISAQEEERRRLARELHDDLTQRMAVLAIDIGNFEGQSRDASPSARQKLRDMKDGVVKISEDMHTISRRLHPSILDDLGLVDAIRSESFNFTRREGIPFFYEPEDIPSGIPKEISLCLYRVFQEGLRNIAKHARASQVHIHLFCRERKIHLSIRDNGIGFNRAQALAQHGLGLASMEERVR
ncbi:MAG TPA: histidine kinase, partial [Candidatus Acidoferrum sp.]|nr:histidine kinase [Candidatus Acidoferrum sp.]